MAQAEDVNLSAVVLAPDDEGLRKVFGIPAIHRIMKMVRQEGCEDIHVFGPEAFRSIMSTKMPPENFHPAADLPSLRNILSEIPFASQKRILVVKANTVLDRPTLNRYASSKNGPACLQPGAIDGAEGICITSAESLLPVATRIWSPDSGQGQGPGVSQKLKAANALPCIVKGPDGAEKAEKKLVEALGIQTRESDGFLARHISRRVSRPLSLVLAQTPITPNQVTIMNTLLGLFAAYLLARGSYWHQLAGSLLFVLCVIADGIDGEIARLKLKESNFGHLLDVITDNIVHLAIFLGLGAGLYRSSGDSLYMGLFWLLVGGFLLNIVVVYFRILKKTPEELQESPRAVRLMALMTNRDFAYLILALAFIGQLQLFMIGAAIGSYVFAAALLYFTYRR
jgi:phosphatidylglycerophosphate synthase